MSAIVACNHQGYMDPFLLQMATPRSVRYLMTADFYDLPVAGVFFKLMGTIRVHSGPANRDALRTALAELRSGALVGIFPEGRLSLDGSFNRLLPGAVFLARRAGVPVVPARIRGSIRVLPKGARFPNHASVLLRFGPPLAGPVTADAIREAWERL